MTRAPVRRSQMIAPFGVGAMLVSPDGVSMIAGGLDHWYERETGERAEPEEFRIQEWRLQMELDVDSFRLPPDFRRPRSNVSTPNALLKVPFLRFPLWHVCPRCSRLDCRGLTEKNRILCRHCLSDGYRRPLHQVPFIAICDHSHIQDFPFREWVHRSVNPHCGGDMWLYAVGASSLGGQIVKCDCGVQRSLDKVMHVYQQGEETHLTNNLEDGELYLCLGRKPWLGTEASLEDCGRPLRGSLRSATNVYFAQQRSAIYLPRQGGGATSDLVSLLEQPPLSTLIQTLVDADVTIEPQMLRKKRPQILAPFTDDEAQAAIDIIMCGNDTESEPPPDEDPSVTFRRPEFEALRRRRTEPELLIRATDLSSYGPDITQYLSRLALVDKLKETRVFTGFTRVLPDTADVWEVRHDMLWRTQPLGESWLPAYVVHGEGIYLELDEQRLREWETRPEVVDRVQKLRQRYEKVQSKRGLRQPPPSPRYVLLHTLSHLLMLRLTFECGYGTASLAERLFVSADPTQPMAGILIYTAAGDSEGTLGGLVRMGAHENLDPVIRRALESASWCSADPICMEIATHGGQGPDSLNLAACHGCALVPETSCEQFNRFLDRGLVVGDPEANPSLGFFSSLVAVAE